MKKTEKFTILQLVYGMIFVIALLLRLVNLGQTPLAENEAQAALCALDVHSLDCGGISSFYTFFTSIFFAIFGDNNFSSRFLPALVGSLLVLWPFLLEKKAGKKTGLVLALCLALDPVLIQISRSADSFMLGLVFVLYMLAFIWRQEYLKALLFFVFGTLTGASFWGTLFLLAGVWLLEKLFQRLLRSAPERQEAFTCPFQSVKMNSPVFLFAMLVWLVISTHFFTGLGGLLNPVQSLALLFSPSKPGDMALTVPAQLRFAIFLFYSAFGLVLSIAAIFRRDPERAPLKQFAATWMVLALLVYLFLGSSLYSIAWVSIPMWLLAAPELFRIAENIYHNWRKLLIPCLIGLVVLIYLALQILRLSYLISLGLDVQKNLLLLVVPVILCLLFILLYSYGWSGNAAMQVVEALFLLLGMLGLWRTANRAANLSGNAEYEVVREAPYLHNADTLLDEIEEYRISQGIFPADLHIGLSSGEFTRSMKWLLRDYQLHEVVQASTLNSGQFDVMINRDPQIDPPDGFYGQDLALLSNVKVFKVDYSGFLPNEILEWLIYRRGSLDLVHVALWFKF
ncbi:MAG: hypothetical protein GYA52_00705 [Chloroflexi bacterium]|nr:hypothetical protein [Chloroflexota bacterium]